MARVAGRDRVGRESQVAERPDILVHRRGQHGDARHAVDRLHRRQGRGIGPREPDVVRPPDARQCNLRRRVGREDRASRRQSLAGRAGEGRHRQLRRRSAREQRVECSDRRRRVDRQDIGVGYAGLDPAQQVAGLGDAIRDRREARVARDDERVGAPQVAVAPGSGRSVELPDEPGDIRADAERRVCQAAVRLGHPHDVRALVERRAFVGRVLLHLVDHGCRWSAASRRAGWPPDRCAARSRAGSRRPADIRASRTRRSSYGASQHAGRGAFVTPRR